MDLNLTAMKRILLPLSALCALLLVSCEKSGVDASGADSENPTEESLPTSNHPVYISPGIGNSILKKAIEQTFLNQVTLAEAEIGFFGTSDPESEWDALIDREGFAVFCNIDDNFRVNIAPDNSFLSSIPVYVPNTEEHENLMLYGINEDGSTFYMPWPYDIGKNGIPELEPSTDTGSENPDPEDPDDPNALKDPA